MKNKFKKNKKTGISGQFFSPQIPVLTESVSEDEETTLQGKNYQTLHVALVSHSIVYFPLFCINPLHWNKSLIYSSGVGLSF